MSLQPYEPVEVDDVDVGDHCECGYAEGECDFHIFGKEGTA